jgi:glycosyltransferase involved in cell wall biosynthesis
MRAQTLADFELIVVDDGSTDDSVAVVEAIDDPRIRIIRHAGNRGIPQARNSGLDAARGRFIAWLDSDDFAAAHRLQTQIAFLDAHPDVALVGCCAGKRRADGTPQPGVRVPPLSPDDVRAWLLFRSAFQQSSIIGHAKLLKPLHYREDFPVCEDHEWFIRLARTQVLLNMPQVLVDRRIHAQQTARLQQSAVMAHSQRLAADNLVQLGIDAGEPDLRGHVLLGSPKRWNWLPERAELDWAERWLCRLREANARRGVYSADALVFTTGYFWMLACRAAIPRLGFAGAARAYLGSRLMPGLLSNHARIWLHQVFKVKRAARNKGGSRVHATCTA